MHISEFKFINFLISAWSSVDSLKPNVESIPVEDIIEISAWREDRLLVVKLPNKELELFWIKPPSKITWCLVFFNIKLVISNPFVIIVKSLKLFSYEQNFTLFIIIGSGIRS